MVTDRAVHRRTIHSWEVECSAVECQPADNGSWRSANKSDHPIQNPLLLVTEPQTRENTYSQDTIQTCGPELHSKIFWIATPCSSVEVHRRASQLKYTELRPPPKSNSSFHRCENPKLDDTTLAWSVAFNYPENRTTWGESISGISFSSVFLINLIETFFVSINTE
jgi:hypothetical protein